MSKLDLPTVTSGLAIVAFGLVLLLDRSGALHLDFGSTAPVALAAVGVILLVGGLAHRDGA
jgi:hypothetical protein